MSDFDSRNSSSRVRAKSGSTASSSSETRRRSRQGEFGGEGDRARSQSGNRSSSRSQSGARSRADARSREGARSPRDVYAQPRTSRQADRYSRSSRRYTGDSAYRTPDASIGPQGRSYDSKAVLRNRIVFGAVVVIALLVLAFAVSSCVRSCTSAERVEESANSQAAAQVPDGALGEVSHKLAAGVQAKKDELAKRDADFAVDPNRTDWNFQPTPGKKVLHLTFDDGPSENTQAVLDILDRYDAKATFFVIGQNTDYYDLIKKEYDKGHTIGLHSLTHDYQTCYSSVDSYFQDLEGMGAIVKDQIGYVPCFIRFPGGSSNTISTGFAKGIMTTLTGEVQKRGYQYYDWNASSGDGGVLSTEDIIAQSTDQSLLQFDSITLLCHDAVGKETTVEALPAIIEHYLKNGYSLEAIDRSSMVAHHEPSN